jgi:hypothetical protein
LECGELERGRKTFDGIEKENGAIKKSLNKLTPKSVS